MTVIKDIHLTTLISFLTSMILCRRSLIEEASKEKQWSNESMLAALEVVKSGTPVLQAARENGVPRQTLDDRVSGRTVHGVKPGPRPYLSPPEE